MNVESLEIDARFCGPPNSGNGGYVCGRIARQLRGTVSVRLKAPPPLHTPLRREWSDDHARLLHGSTLIGEAKKAELHLEAPPRPDFATCERAVDTYLGFRRHLFPRCFVCGPERAAGDGLRIFPGALPEPGLLAAPWVPDESLADATGAVASEFVWAALDCPSGFAVLPVPEGSAIVLGELCATLVGELAVGQRAVVTAWPIGQEGRRRMAASAIHTEHGQPVAVARAVWIEVPHEAWIAPRGDAAGNAPAGGR
ncbi:MAG: hypothetical protein KIT17_06800 [Rubrivivax sp.]|nr:hypothetical protein [Rubrivivax sp.]